MTPRSVQPAFKRIDLFDQKVTTDDMPYDPNETTTLVSGEKPAKRLHLSSMQPYQKVMNFSIKKPVKKARTGVLDQVCKVLPDKIHIILRLP